MAKKRKQNPVLEQGRRPRPTLEQQHRKSKQVVRNRQAALDYLAKYERDHDARLLEQKKARAAKRNRETFPRASDVTVTRADGTVAIIPAHKTPGQLRRVAPERLPIPEEMRNKILARDGYACRYCGSERAPFEMDHVLAVVRGGATSMGNLVTACGPCNSRKGTDCWKPRPLPGRRKEETGNASARPRDTSRMADNGTSQANRPGRKWA